jgi:hypothetical protein
VRVVVRFLLTMVMLAGLGFADSVAYAEGPTNPTQPTPSDPVPSPSSESPSPGDQPSEPTPSQPATSQPSASSSAPSSPAAPQSRSRLLAAAGDDGHTTITNPPDRLLAYPNRKAQDVTFRYRLDKGIDDTATTVEFRCWMNGNRKTCPVDTRGANETTGSTTLSLGPTYKPYKFTVRAFWGTTPLNPTEHKATDDAYEFRVYSIYRPGSFMPHDGASFNNPLSSRRAGRTNLTRMIKTINAMPGYRQGPRGGACPKPGSGFVPGNIRVSLYSMVDTTFAKAMIAASRRCLSVQILMNNHLNRHTDSSWRRMEDALGYRTKSHSVFRRSFAHRCHFACRGGGVLHTKMFLFNSTLPNRASSWNKITDTTFVGSSNMTSNASYIQWNDLYGDVGNKGLFDIFNGYYNKMRKDNGYHRNGYRGYSSGIYNAVFWPVTKGHDPEMAALRAIRCSGAGGGGTGINGHTAVYINMHAWFGLRGLAFQRIVRGLYSKGCYVRILYSFMTPRVYSRLKSGTGSRMQLRRTIFASHPGGHVAGVYSHFKNILVSGRYGANNGRWVWTGSNNFTPDGKNFDEVMLRIHSKSVFRQYYRHFNYIKHRKSSGSYASFTEPRGGGRAP